MNQQFQRTEPVAPLEGIIARLGGPAGLVAAFALAHAILLHIGFSLKETIATPAVMWPSAGLALALLWMAPLRLWLALLATQLVVEGAVATLWLRPIPPGIIALYTLGSLLGTALGAGVARWVMPQGNGPMRTRDTLWLILVTGVASLGAALIGAAVNVANYAGTFSTAAYVADLQTWWGGNWLGCLVITPVFLCWLSPIRFLYPELALRSRWELAALAVLMAGFAIHVFSIQDPRSATLLQLPTTIIALMLLCTMRLPPRWATVLCALTALICAAYVSEGRGPFQVDYVIERVGQSQAFLASLAAICFALAVTISENDIAMHQLRDAEERYRSFVTLSAEAVWRVELDQPMPVTLSCAEQVMWLREHAKVVEASRTYEMIDPQAAGGGWLPWRREVGWTAVYEDQLPLAAAQDYSINGLSFRLDVRGRRHTFVTSFSGVVDNGCLLRIWGVARDITELSELNARLLREQERLKTYARQLVSAEEKARRATAVDLHDGIGQSLAGMAMTLDVARQQATPQVQGLIQDVRTRLREVQDRTRHMISDLSPPGLYELGLEPALQWLAVYMKSHDRLQVDMNVNVLEEHIPLEMRVLVFKLVRELLRNVVKHAGVNAARLTVSGTAGRLQVEVADRGKGFEWQMDMFGADVGAFGLWSIADRVHEAGGRFSVDTAPGRGARFEMAFPLGAGLVAAGRAQAAGIRA